MRWAALCLAAACIKADPPVVCGQRICPPGSVCQADGTCAIPPASPTRLVFDNRASKTDLVDFPVLVTLDASTVDYAQVADPRRDLGFRTVDTDQDLPFDVERWDPTGESLVWVLLPRVAAGTNTDALAVYFGPDANRSAAAFSAVWQDYELVVHGNGALGNAAAAAYPAQTEGVTVGPAWIGDGAVFSPMANGNVTFTNSEPLLDGWPQFSLGFWLYPNYSGSLPSGTEPRVIAKDASGAISAGRIYQYTGVDDVFAFQIDVHLSSAISYESYFIQPQTWVYVVYTFDGQVLRLYRDGTVAGLVRLSSPGTLAADPSVLVLGSSAQPSLDGTLDELRISKHAMSPDTVRAQFLSQTRRLLRAR